jgi:hypothetical protein
MHGNVWEWTCSAYLPYPYRTDDGRNDLSNTGRKIVRGGSWYDRPKRCRSAFRLSYPAWQKVYNVGFRIVLEPKQTFFVTAAKEEPLAYMPLPRNVENGCVRNRADAPAIVVE